MNHPQLGCKCVEIWPEGFIKGSDHDVTGWFWLRGDLVLLRFCVWDWEREGDRDRDWVKY